MVLKIDYLKVAWQIFHSFVSVSKKDLPNISLKLAGAQEVCPSRLSRTENKLPLISACAWIIHKSYFIRPTDFSIQKEHLIQIQTEYMNKQLLVNVNWINKAFGSQR